MDTADVTPFWMQGQQVWERSLLAGAGHISVFWDCTPIPPGFPGNEAVHVPGCPLPSPPLACVLCGHGAECWEKAHEGHRSKWLRKA